MGYIDINVCVLELLHVKQDPVVETSFKIDHVYFES